MTNFCQQVLKIPRFFSTAFYCIYNNVKNIYFNYNIIDSHHDIMCITLGMMLRSPARSELLHPKHHQCFMQHPRTFQKHSSLVCHYHGM